MSYDSDSGLVFESIIFRGGLLEMSGSEEHDRNNGIINVRTLVGDAAVKAPKEYAAFMIASVDLYEALQLALRNPPEEIGG